MRIKKTLFIIPFVGLISCSSSLVHTSKNSFNDLSNIIINPWDPWNPPGPTDPDLPDASTSFLDALTVSLSSVAYDDFQTTDDVDYYKYEAVHTNYIYFNIERDIESGNASSSALYADIEVYKLVGENIVATSYSYNNDDTLYGDDIDTLPSIYTDAGETYYFKVSKRIASSHMAKRNDDINTITRRYKAIMYYANCTDVANTELYETNGYLLGYQLGYVSDSIIKVYFDERAYNYQNTVATKTYKDICLEAMSIWNKAGSIQFVETLDETEHEIYVYTLMDIVEGMTTMGCTDFSYGGIEPYSRALVWINNNVFYGENYLYCLKTTVHELGHCLGINDIDYIGCNDIMKQGHRMFDKLGKGDLDLYRYLYGN